MKSIKKLGVLVWLLLLLFAVAEAKQGFAISPSAGTYTFSRQGGTLQVTLYSTGDEDYTYKFVLGGNAAKYASLDMTEGVLNAGDILPIYITIKPGSDLVFGEKYKLALAVNPVEKAGAAGSGTGTNIIIGSTAVFGVVFEASNAPPVVYQSTDVEKTRASLAQLNKPNYVPLILVGVAVGGILISVFFYIRKRKEEEEEDIVVEKKP